MALGMKHWIGLVVAGCLAVALQALPPSAWEAPERMPELQAERHSRVLTGKVATANSRLVRLRWAKEYVARTLSDNGPLAFGVPEGAEEAIPERVAQIREEALAQLEAAAPGETDVAVGLFYVDGNEGSYPRAFARGPADGEFLFGTRDGRAYCVTLLSASNWRERWRLSGVSQGSSRLGLCQFVARYGLPGPAVEAWLGNGGASFTTRLEPSRPDHYSFSTLWSPGYRRRTYLGVLGNGSYNVGMGMAQQQCFAGQAEGCAALFEEPNVERWYYSGRMSPKALVRSTPVSAVQTNSFLEPADQYVVADLEAEFGRDAVEAWWKADGDLDQAFHEAFGVEVGEWYKARAARLVTITPPGPAVAGMGLLGVLLVLAMAAGVAGMWSRGRTV